MLAISDKSTPTQRPLAGSASRPLALRMRAGLEVQQQRYQGRDYWIVKDPLALKYYRFEEEEFAILQMLDGETTLEELQHRFEQRFSPQRITRQELHQLVASLHRAALTVSDAPGQGQQLLERRRKARKQEWLHRLSNVLSIRLPGFDPDRLLTWLDRRLGWFFSGTVCLAAACGAVAALILILVQFETFSQKLPAFREFFATGNWVWLAATLAATKVLHEFGHGLACKRFGGECHEMGVLFLVFTPCLYCNVSDSWMLPNKWKRAAIGAAGMYVELVLATLCTWLWWFTHPGMLNYLCLNVMLVCSVSTLLFNANPLLRYDGYYILSDLIEIPNLRQKAEQVLRRKLAKLVFGLAEQPDPFLPQRHPWLFAAYAVAAAIYRWVIAVAIFWFLYRVLEPYGLKVIGQLMACLGLLGLVVRPAWQFARFLHFPGRVERVNRYRASVAATLAGLALAAIFLLPLPYRVQCTLYLKPRDAATVYVDSAGTLQAVHARPGDWVDRGQPIATLENVDTHLAVERLAGERHRLTSRLRSLRLRAFEDEQAAMEVPEVEKALASVEEQLAARTQDIQQLTLAAPVAGVVIAPPRVPPQSPAAGRLPGWTGSPFDPRNLSSFLPSGTHVCHVGNPNHLEAILAIEEGTVEFLHPGQRVDIVLDQLPGTPFRSRVEQLSQVDMKLTPRNLSSRLGGELLSRTDAAGRDRPLTTTYQANALLNDDNGLLVVGATGKGKIYARPQTVAQRLWRYACRTFNFEGNG